MRDGDIPKQGCFNCVHNDQKLGHCDLMGERFGRIMGFNFFETYKNEKAIKECGSTCKTWKRGTDLFKKWYERKVRERVNFT